MLADGRFPAHIRDMAIPCPKCTVRAAIGIEGEFVFFGGQCIELSGTRYVNRFEWCPILSEAIAQEVRRQTIIGRELTVQRPTAEVAETPDQILSLKALR